MRKDLSAYLMGRSGSRGMSNPGAFALVAVLSTAESGSEGEEVERLWICLTGLTHPSDGRRC